MYLGFFHRSCFCTMVLPTLFQRRFGNTSSLSLAFFHVLLLLSLILASFLYSSFRLLYGTLISLAAFSFVSSVVSLSAISLPLIFVWLGIYITFILLSLFLVYSKNLLLPYTYSCRLSICCPLNLLLRSWHWSK